MANKPTKILAMTSILLDTEAITTELFPDKSSDNVTLIQLLNAIGDWASQHQFDKSSFSFFDESGNFLTAILQDSNESESDSNE